MSRTAVAIATLQAGAAFFSPLHAQTPEPGKPRAATNVFRDGCSQRDLIGSFGFVGSGSVLVSPVVGLAGTFSRVGLFHADGAGGLRFSSRAAFNGIHFHQDFTGSYTMRPDCTFTALVDLPFSHPSITPFVLHATFHGILSDGGREMQDLFLDPPGVAIYGKARKQSISQCTTRDLFGSYQLDVTGSMVDLGFPVPFVGNGRLEADGNGRLSGKVFFNNGGFALPFTIAGTYTVATDCTFELSYCTLAQDGTTCQKKYAHHGAFLNDGDAAYMVMTEPQTAVVIGGLKVQ